MIRRRNGDDRLDGALRLRDAAECKQTQRAILLDRTLLVRVLRVAVQPVQQDESIVVGGGAIEIAHRAQRSLGGIGGGHEQQDRQDHRHQTGGCGNRAVARKRAASHRSTG